MAEERSLSIVFRPGMYPNERHAIEDELEEALGELGDITGGGTTVDLSECDISLDVTDIQTALPIIREVLQRLQVPKSTVIWEFEPVDFEPVHITHLVYEAE
jgi:hypothetical protein